MNKLNCVATVLVICLGLGGNSYGETAASEAQRKQVMERMFMKRKVELDLYDFRVDIKRVKNPKNYVATRQNWAYVMPESKRKLRALVKALAEDVPESTAAEGISTDLMKLVVRDYLVATHETILLVLVDKMNVYSKENPKEKKTFKEYADIFSEEIPKIAKAVADKIVNKARKHLYSTDMLDRYFSAEVKRYYNERMWSKSTSRLTKAFLKEVIFENELGDPLHEWMKLFIKEYYLIGYFKGKTELDDIWGYIKSVESLNDDLREVLEKLRKAML